MTPTIEVETKLELAESDFHSLLARGRVSKQFDQLNVYFDDGWRLANAAATCRVRLAGGKACLTIKLPLMFQAGVRTMRELEQCLDSKQVREFCRGRGLRSGVSVREHMSEDACHALLELGVERLSCAGWARTSRYVLEFVDVGEIELDRLRLPHGGVVYEVEVEQHDDAIRQRIVQFIYQVAPSARPVTISKFERFREAILLRAGHRRSAP